MSARGLAAVFAAMVTAVAGTAHAQTIASPRGANAEGLGVEGTWDGTLFLELAYTRRLASPLLGRPGGLRLSLGATVPARTVRAAAGLAIVAASAGDLALALLGAVVSSAGAIDGGHMGSFGVALGAQAGWMAERAYVTAFASVRPTLASMTVIDGDLTVSAWPSTRFVFGVQAGAAITPALIVFVAAGAHHTFGQGEVGPVVTAGVRAHP